LLSADFYGRRNETRREFFETALPYFYDCEEARIMPHSFMRKRIGYRVAGNG
jgi:hypothetical protein